MLDCWSSILWTACAVLAAAGEAKAIDIAAEVRLEVFFYPGTSRVLCNIGFEGYKKASQVAQARVIVFGPDQTEVAHAVVTEFDEETAAPFVPIPKDRKVGEYRVEVSLHDRAGRHLAGPAKDTFTKRNFPFEGNTLGVSNKVLPPGPR
jgi:hypothetical protein